MYTLLSTTTTTAAKVIGTVAVNCWFNIIIIIIVSDHSSKKDISITTNEAYQIINRQPVLQDNIAYEPINMNKQDTSRVYETIDVS